MNGMHEAAANKHTLWYKDAIIYELHIKAFFDSNGDGIGDFAGLLRKLDYLQQLGVTAIWVLPFYPSPLKDDGYDIADYYAINPSYGTIEQFSEFLEEAHKRKLKVITELVINHTSDQHPWFQRARLAPKGSPERDYYVWTDDPQQYKDVRIIFQDFEASNWTWDPVAAQYYWHRFFHHQPDLNYDNPLVQEEIFRILDYWCAMGVDGFRLDAVPYLFERENTNGENLPETHAFLKKLRSYIDERYPGICFLAEANMWPEEAAAYFGNGDECHMNYHFPVMPRMFMALQREDRYPITDIFDQTPDIPANCQWAIFLRNHDELTLEMVTDEERDYMYKVYAKDPKARINLGIRHRLAPLMENDRKRIELMNSLLFSLPGTPVIYYGDEIGMGDNFYLGDRDGVRTPMQWSPDRNAGFSVTNPQRLYLPVILDPQYHYESVNVETQSANTSSLLWFMKRIIHTRKKYKAFSRGNLQFIHVDNPKILAFTRTHDNETVLVVVNLSRYAQPVAIDLDAHKNHTPVEIFSQNHFPSIKEHEPYFFTLAPHSFQWFVLEHTGRSMQHQPDHPMIYAGNWDALFTDASERLQNEILPSYCKNAEWLSGYGSKIISTSILQQTEIPLKNTHAVILMIEVSFDDRLPEWYHLPLMYISEAQGKSLSKTHPFALMAQLELGNEKGWLADATYVTAYQHYLLDYIRHNKRFMSNGEVVFTATAPLTTGELVPRVQNSNRIFTSIIFGNTYYMKIFRRIDTGVHPDVEITRLLSQISGKLTTNYHGGMAWNMANTQYDLVMLELLEENHGNGFHYMQDRVVNYIERILARDKTIIAHYKKQGSFTAPTGFEQLDDTFKEFLGSNAAEFAAKAGAKLASVHLALASDHSAAFLPEPFSLHYQRSLYAAMNSLLRETMEAIAETDVLITPPLHELATTVLNAKENIRTELKKIYSRKFDVFKSRIHGNMELRNIMLTGDDLLIHNFGGKPFKPFSQWRLKRSAMRDVAAMVHAFYYVAYEGFLQSPHLQDGVQRPLLHYADLWAFYMSSFFLEAYYNRTKRSGLIPASAEDTGILLQCFLIENALWRLKDQLLQGHPSQEASLRVLHHFIGNQ